MQQQLSNTSMPQLPPMAQMMPQGTLRAANLNLRQIDQIGESAQAALALNGQPLSPTQTSSNKQSSRIIKDNGKQKQLKGPPQHVGLTTIEYGIDSRSQIAIKDIATADIQKNYLKDIYDEQQNDFPFKSISEQFAPGEMYQRVEVGIQLPFDMGIEQVELQIANQELFSKYLKLLKIETHNLDRPQMHLRGGFYDQVKRILEVNTCGLTNFLKLVFLYNFDNKPKRLEGGLKAPRGENSGSHLKNLNMSDKIKNEIIPLLNVATNDDEMDELDDEVAMISNKKSQDGGGTVIQTGKDAAIISPDDIKIEVRAGGSQDSQRSAKSASNVPQKPGMLQIGGQQQVNRTGVAKNSEEENRNFNTIPRNYSESQGLEHNQQQYQTLQDQPQQDLAFIEQEIFDSSEYSCHNQLTSQQQLGEILKLFQKSISTIKIIGFNCNQIPAITSLTTFMNNSFLLKKEGHAAEAFEFDFIIGVLMISSKRYTQAVEIFRKIQASYLNQIEAKSKDSAKHQSKAEINKLYIKCALLELLTAESMCQAPQINDKLLSLKRMCDLFQGKSVSHMVFSPQLHFMEDPYTIILKLLPGLLKFVLMCVTHKKEIVRMSSMKLLEFILETKGCSLDSSMVYILKAILNTYPSSNGGSNVNSSQNQISTTQQQQQQQQTTNLKDEGNKERSMHHQDSFCLQNLSQSVQEYFQYQTHKRSQPEYKSETVTEYKAIKEPNSGFLQAQKNVYNHVLETYISVLSSISSHILHQLFYEVIIPTLTSQTVQPDVKIFAIKIAEKIITICQGDLVLSKQSLEYFLLTVSQKQQASASSDQQSYITNLRSLWTSVRTKVFANYSQKGLKTLIDWLVDKMSAIAQNAGINNKDMGVALGGAMDEDHIDEQSNPDISKLEITDEESNQLQQIFDIISVVSVSRKKNEEEANSHIKIKQDYILELYLLINPLLFWLDFSVEREDRFPLFKSVYQTIKDVLDNLPPKRIDIDLLQIMIPILQRTTEYLKNNSPSLSMLKFLDIVLRDIKASGFCQVQSDLQYFFLEMLNNFVNYISYCLYEEVFSVFDKLLSMSADVINEKVLIKCVCALVDKYTMKSKQHKVSLGQFMKVLMEVKVRQKVPGSGGGGLGQGKNHSNNNNADSDEHDFDDDQISVHSKNNYFQILCNFCFFNNEDPSISKSKPEPLAPIEHFKSPTDQHDLYMDKMQFFIESLQMLTEMHINLFTQMIMNPKFKSTILTLLTKGELQLRLKCHEILEVVTNYYSQYCTSKTVYELAISNTGEVLNEYHNKKKAQHHSEVMEVEYINQERLYISQVVVQCIKLSLDQKNDSYLQFNSLILLDFLFQNLLPVPTFQNEQLKDKVGSNQKSGSGSGNNKSNNQNQSINNYGNSKGSSGSDSLLLDIETLEINESTPELEATSRQYMLMRLSLIFKLWPFVQQALNSAWSNIRSICYGLICSMLKIDIRDFQKGDATQTHINQQFLMKLQQIVLPMLMNLLSSKESESKAGGLNILGSFCGLSYDFSAVKISKSLDFFRKNSKFISLSIWQLVFDLQDDWDITIKEASVVLIQLCAPRDAVKYFDKLKREKENAKFQNMILRYGMGPGGDQSSRLSSSRGAADAQLQFLNSAGSMNGENEEMLSGIPQAAGNKDKGNILSFLSGTVDDMSLVFQMDQHNQQQQKHNQRMAPLSASAEMLEHIAGPTGLSLSKQDKNRNERQIGDGFTSSSEELKEGDPVGGLVPKKHSYLGEFDDALQYQELLEQQQHLDDASSPSHFVFFVDRYADDQIQEIISIFRNDFKPPKNLWIEKNPSVAFNQPDYYAEIFSSAIDQFNQQQMQLQQQQQQQLQQQLSSSPKLSSSSQPSSQGKGAMVVDAVEDDIVKKFENEKKEKEQKMSESNTQQPGSQQAQQNFMIFERHFEDKEGGEGGQKDDSSFADEEMKKDDLSVNSSNGNQASSDTCSIDAEPFQFLDSPKLQPVQNNIQGGGGKQKQMKPNKSGTAIQGSLQILDDDTTSGGGGKSNNPPKSAKGPNKDKSALIMVDGTTKSKDSSGTNLVPIGNKKTTDELIEEYERKINKTKSLLEEEKKRVAQQQNSQESGIIGSQPTSYELINNLTPEFKGKLSIEVNKGGFIKEDKGNDMQKMSKESKKSKVQAQQQPQLVNQQTTQLQTYLTDFQQKGYSNSQGLDNAKLLKQIKNCFNDTGSSSATATNTHNLVNIVGTMSTTPQSGKIKQKLNKSYENLGAQGVGKGQTKNNVNETQKSLLGKKNLSTSPRRGSSSGKKGCSSRGGVTKKQYLQQMQQAFNNCSAPPIQDIANANKNRSAQMYNMKDLNFFIKNIEKDLTDKFNRSNMKDFNSMPTTPTSILKKVEDQMRALATKDNKAQMSNTCPNIAQVLSTLESNTSKSVGPPSSTSATNHTKRLHPNIGTETHRQLGVGTNLLGPGQVINFQTINHGTLMTGQSHNSLTNYPTNSAMSYNSGTGSNNAGDKFQFSKTQKIDLKDGSKNMLSYNIPLRDGAPHGITHRDNTNSNDNRNKTSLSPFKDDISKQHFTNLLKQSKHHKKSGKRSRGSTDKYMLLGGGVQIGQQAASAITGGPVINNYGPMGSSSFTKLNKSAHNIQGASYNSTNTMLIAPLISGRGGGKGGENSASSLSQMLINSFAKANNMSPNNKKLLQQMVKHQFVQQSSSQHSQPPHSATLPQALSAQNNSIIREFGPSQSNNFTSTVGVGGEQSKRGAVNSKSSNPLQILASSSSSHSAPYQKIQGKEKTPKKQQAITQRKDYHGKNNDGVELSPMIGGNMYDNHSHNQTGNEKQGVGLKNSLKTKQ